MYRTIASGRLIRSVNLYSITTTKSETGDMTEGETLLGSALAEITPLSSRELQANAGIEAQATHKITMRFINGFRHSSFIMYGQRRFNIESVIDPTEDRALLVFHVKEVV